MSKKRKSNYHRLRNINVRAQRMRFHARQRRLRGKFNQDLLRRPHDLYYSPVSWRGRGIWLRADPVQKAEVRRNRRVFGYPSFRVALVCTRRKIRRGVMFAEGHVGVGVPGPKLRILTRDSKIKC